MQTWVKCRKHYPDLMMVSSQLTGELPLGPGPVSLGFTGSGWGLVIGAECPARSLAFDLRDLREAH